MNRKAQWLFAILLTLILASLACSAITGGTPPPVTVPDPAVPTVIIESGEATTPPELPTPTTAPGVAEPTPAEGETTGENTTPGAESISLDDPALYTQPAGVNTYRTSLVFTFSGQAEDGTAVTGSVNGEGAFSVNPAQMSFSFQTSTSDFPAGTMEIVQLENSIYMASAELGCFTLPLDSPDADNPYEELLDTGGFLTGQATRVQPDETVNDIPVYVYEITSANLDTSDPTAQEVTEITFGRIYLAKDGGYVVRLVLDGRGRNTLASDTELVGDVHYEINYFDQNEPVNIVPPANCAGDTGGGTGDTGGGVAPTGDFPIPESATDLVSITGLTTFSSDQTVEELTTFFKTEMVTAGWTAGEEITLPGLTTLMFTKDGTTATVTIASDPSTGRTQVTIFEG